jgi:hypothetical protein
MPRLANLSQVTCLEQQKLQSQVIPASQQRPVIVPAAQLTSPVARSKIGGNVRRSRPQRLLLYVATFLS